MRARCWARLHAQQNCSCRPRCRERGLCPGIGRGVVQAQHETDRPANPVALRCRLKACSSSRTRSQTGILIRKSRQRTAALY